MDSLLRVLERTSKGHDGRLPVLTYHRVLDPAAAASAPSGLVSADPAGFDAQIQYLADAWHPVGLEEVLAARRGGTLPPRAVLVTFDDAYRDFASNAWPILRRYGVPATLFVPTAFPDHPGRAFWWDRVHHAVTTTANPTVLWCDRELPVDGPARGTVVRTVFSAVKDLPHHDAMAAVDALVQRAGTGAAASDVIGWDGLRALAAEGVTLAPHTRTHPLLDRLTPDEATAEIAGSCADLVAQVGSCVPVLAYPDGHEDAATVRSAKEAGIEMAFTTQRGVNDLRRADWMRLARINVGARANVPVLRAQLLPVARRMIERVG